MNRGTRKSQSGYVLLFMVLALLGIAGVVGASFTQNVKKTVERERYLHNEQVLKDAKQALLMYAYNYPDIALAFNGTIRGPGRLPCPDTDAPGGAGTPNPVANCIAGGNAIVGRFPWNANGLEFYDVRDATNERLWYAVSQNFANPDLDVINSDTLGTITIHDQSGSLLYDGSVAGVAAVIIAPGPAIDRGGVVQLRQTAAQQLNPTNYLDLFGALDNADFINSNAADGFVLGPVDNLAASTIIVNDQIILVTAEEVVAMAEQATLQAYQKAINDYNANIGVDAYPWLDDYLTTPSLAVFDAEVGTRLGRVPSIFTNYFDNDPAAEIGQPVLSDVRLRINLAPVLIPFPVPSLVADVISADATITFNVAVNGDLTMTPSVAGASEVHYYWDEEPAGDGWQECLPLVTFDERDCRQAETFPGSGVCTGIPDGTLAANECATQVVRVTYTNTLAAGVPYTRPFADITATPLVYEDPTAGDHAYVFAEYADVTADAIDVTYFFDNYFLNSLDNVESGDVTYSLGVRYYPELPGWALDPALTPGLGGNDWHDSMQLAYAAGFAPGAAATCTPGGLPPANCLTVNNAGGIANDKIVVLTIASDHGLIDDDDNAVPIPAAPGYTDELDDIFDPDNDNADDTFDAWSLTNNDKVLVIR
ncbi:MAG: hypothetical protein KJN95_11045 [Gammaproteobacteria bacterium]|nr:hypothetical protein [Gammaproteobacteria bacterium]